MGKDRPGVQIAESDTKLASLGQTGKVSQNKVHLTNGSPDSVLFLISPYGDTHGFQSP